MKRMKSCISIFTGLLIMLTLMGGSSISASSSPAYTISPLTPAVVSVGETISINVGISNNPGIIALRCTISYDISALELIGTENSKLLNGYSAPSPVISSPYALRWSDPLAASNNTQNGTVAVLTFKAKKAGKTIISVKHTESRDFNLKNIDFMDASSNLEVTVTASSSNLDSLRRFILNLPASGNNPVNDLNADGMINVFDLVLKRKNG